MVRVILFCLLTLVAINQTLWLFVPLFLWYLGRYTGYELVILAVMIDGYYGAFEAIPWLSLITFGLFIAVTLTKEKLLLYTERDEILS